MEKLNTNGDKKQIVAEVMKEICEYFGFGCGFVYIADHKENFNLYEAFRTYQDFEHLNESIRLRDELGDECYDAFHKDEIITVDAEKPKTKLEGKLTHLFKAQNMVLIPIIGKGNKIQAFVGMADRRSKNRQGDRDIRFAFSIMAVFANYIKIMISQWQSEGNMRTLSSVLNNTGVDVYVADFYTDDVLYVNESMAKRYGGEANIIGRKCWQVMFPGKTGRCDFCPRHRLIDENQEPTEVYIWNLHNEIDDSWRRMLSSAFYWVDGRLAIVGSNVDITNNVKNEEKIRYFAEYDTLTGLKNRHKLLLDCDDGIDRLKREGKEGYLIFCDLNKFKRVNDEMGHKAGDELLSQIGQYFQNNEKTSGRVYRYGGDEFIILCLDYTAEEANALAEQLHEDFKKPWKLQAGEVNCGTSVGITCYPRDAATTSDLLHLADLQMYEAKKRNR